MPAAPVAAMADPLQGAVEILTDQLYYAPLKLHPRGAGRTRGPTSKRVHYFNVDNELVYWNFFLDFGPLNLGQLYRFCAKLNSKMEDPSLSNEIIFFYSSTMPAKRANAIFLICAWQILYLGRTPEEAYRGFRTEGISGSSKALSSHNCSSPPRALLEGTLPPLPQLPPFHDASPCACTYDLNLLDCLRGLAKARMYRYFDFSKFDVEEYEYFEQVENGDLNWIMQDKIIAFAGPHHRRQVTAEGYCTLTPADYVPYFQRKNVGLVVRLNKKCYDENDFLKVGIDHVEHYYLDGSCPPMRILQRVLEAFEAVPQGKAFAVHCKAGLGRTGTCIGAFMMKHYKFTAAEAIGWMRICRPGCVIGPQQHFLQDIEQRMWHEGDVFRMRPQQSRALKVKDWKQRGEERKAADRYESSIVHGQKKVMDSKQSMKVNSLSLESLTVREQERQQRQESEVFGGIEGQADALLARRSQSNHYPLRTVGGSSSQRLKVSERK